jgi:hypothetical protein
MVRRLIKAGDGALCGARLNTQKNIFLFINQYLEYRNLANGAVSRQ